MSREIFWDDFSERKDDRDLGLDVEGKMFWVSRQKLADASPIFKAMLYGDFEESKKEIIQLPEKAAADVLEFLRCLFPTGNVCKQVDDENIDLLLSMAREYQIVQLTGKCSEFLATKIEQSTKDEIIGLFIVGVRHNLKEVVRGTILAIRKLWTCEIPGFDDMPIDVKNAITTVLPPSENPHRWTSNAKYCYTDTKRRVDIYAHYCVVCNTNTVKSAHTEQCRLCHVCRKRIGIRIDDFAWPSSSRICQCIDPMILAELEKVGL